MHRGCRNRNRNFAGRYGEFPPPRGMQLSPVIEEPSSSKAKIRTPQKVAKLARDNRTHGKRVYESVNSLNLGRRIDEETPAGPMGPETFFGDDAIMLGKRGRAVCRRSFEVSPASGYNQWRPHRRMHERLHGAKASLEPLYSDIMPLLQRILDGGGECRND